MSITEDKILKQLQPIQDPSKGKSIVDLGIVANIKIGGGNVSLELISTELAPPLREQIRASCIEAIRTIRGVAHVSVNLSAKARGPQATQQKVLPGVKHVVAVASGKGGVGKSTVSVNLALALRNTGAKVGILDADIYGPSIPTMIRVDELPSPLPDNRIRPATGLGISFISMAFFMEQNRAAILRGPMVSGYVSQFLAHADWGELDYLIVDYPPGTGDIQLTLSQQAPLSGAIIVTTPQEISLVDVRRAISMFETTEVPILGICETMSYFECDGCGKRHEIFRSGGGARISRQTGAPLLAEIPIDPRVAEGGDKGLPIIESAPDSPVAKVFASLAESVASQLTVLADEQGERLDSFSLQWSEY